MLKHEKDYNQWLSAVKSRVGGCATVAQECFERIHENGIYMGSNTADHDMWEVKNILLKYFLIRDKKLKKLMEEDEV